MKKSVSKRFKITKTGKILRRRMSTDHFRTRQSKKSLARKKTRTGLDYPLRKILSY